MKNVVKITFIFVAFLSQVIGYAQAGTETSTKTTNTMTSKKYGMTGKFKAKDGHGPELIAILLKASGLVSSARGIHLYAVCADAANADIIWVMEAWNSKEDHDNSLKIQGVKELIAQAMPLMAGKPEGTVLDIFGIHLTAL